MDDLPDLEIGSEPYTYLPISKDQIRVLTLKPAASRDEPLICNLAIVTLADRPIYDALSYVWGDPSPMSSIRIEGCHLGLARNLDSALRQLRAVDAPRPLWVDAISMDMANLQERGRQILKMRSIFGNAARVIAWLGEETKNCRGALQFLKKVVDTPDTDDVLRGNRTSVYWNIAWSLLSRPYFTRVWVVQEIAIARQAILLLGNASIDWRTFEAAVSISQKRLQLYPDEASWEERRQLLGATRFVHIVHRCFHRDERGDVLAPAMSLERLVLDLSDTKASDVRDKIYALLAIAADIDLEHPQIEPDYNKTPADVFAEFYRFCLKTSGSINTILQPWSIDYPPPIWAPERNDSSGSTSLVELPYETQLFPQYQFATKEAVTFDVDSMIVHGFEIGQLQWEIHLDEVWDNPDIVAGILSDFRQAVTDEQLGSLLELIRQISPRRLSFEVLVAQNTQMEEICRRFLNLVVGRKIYRMRRQLGPCVVPSAATSGDWICFTSNCSMPIVLRQFREGHILIGDCYVPGMMNVARFEIKQPITTFAICPTPPTSRRGTKVPYTVPEEGVPSVMDIPSRKPWMIPTTVSRDDQQPESNLHIELRSEGCRGYRVKWQCPCGYKGSDRYIEKEAGGMKDLIGRLRSQGFTASLERWDPFNHLSDISSALCQARMTVENTLARPVLAQLKVLLGLSQPLQPSEEAIPVATKGLAAGENEGDLLSNGAVHETPPPALVGSSQMTDRPGGASTPGSGSDNGSDDGFYLGFGSVPTPQITSRASTAISSQGQSSQAAAPSAVSSGNQSNVAMPNDFILLCFQIGKYHVRRHDISTLHLTQDRDLRKAFLDAYAKNFSWMHRKLSVWSITDIKFVKFKFRYHDLVDNLEYGVPPVTEAHYIFTPRPTTQDPPMGRKYLMHVFTCAESRPILNDDSCLLQIPKRYNGHPVPGQSPDLYTGWGMEVEEGCFERIIQYLAIGFLIGIIFGIGWSIWKRDVSSGFAVASWIMGSEAVAVAVAQTLLFLHSR